jgi:cytosine/adenosine deaminase-related metal-dependent hydrolase
VGIRHYVIQVYGPWLFDGQEFVEGGVAVENGVVSDVMDSPPEGITHRGMVFPTLANAHTHIGDAFIRRVPKGSVEDIVAPPDGYKFKMLAKTPDRVIAKGIAQAVSEMARTGTGAFVDFRENGLRGIKTLKAALKGQETSAVILGRPSGLMQDAEETRKVLDSADGIGLSSISEWKREDLLAISAQARKAGKIFAIHASERSREDFDFICELEPRFVVHMVKASGKDFKACGRAEIPVVVCPRSNAFFGFKPPVRRMLDAGIDVALGTDNAMLARPDMLAEARFLARTQNDLTPVEIVRMSVSAPRKVLNLEPGLRLKKGNPADFVVLAAGRGDPARAFLAPGKTPLVVRGARTR